LAYFTWRFVEAPFRKKGTFNRFKIFLYASIASIFFIAFGLVGHFTNGQYFRVYDKDIQATIDASTEIGKNKKCWDLITKNNSLSNACLIGNKALIKNFAIVGDSHAGALVEELGRAAAAANIAGFDYTYNSCPPLLGGLSKEQDETQIVCNALRKDFFSMADQNLLPKTLILSSRWTILLEKNRFNNKEGSVETGKEATWLAHSNSDIGYENALKNSYVESVQYLLDRGYKIILIYPVPEMAWDVPKTLGKIALRNGTLNAKDASTSYDVFLERNKKAYEALDAIGEHPNLIKIKPELIFCNTNVGGRCIAHIGGFPLYYDDDHLSNVGAKLVVPEIIEHIKK
jgi:hypothetical protein